ncbi:DUF4190 domain-containing protein [Micromonospora sp. WMMD1155]|uniref:DUF4190 domain-containing protein n=1 Tax=Micromonospora sp. WMMD1155 TaxID=3016094 RepID=UPI00249CD81F|nr:DUF4190 domain-containing protein [Micromonospora sp. WMMD1155]WFE50436.1 DUF4190 domain-containing protein [Micromonospora sp. WMMD1155]
MTNPPPPGGWSDPTWSAQPSSPAPDPTVVAGQPVPTQPGPIDPYAPTDPYAGAKVQPVGAYGPPGYPPPHPGYGYPPPQKTNGLAIASLVLALVGLTSCGITAPIGAILGHVAQKQIRLSGEGGEGMAKAGIIVGWIITALMVLGIAFYVVAIIFAVTTGSSGGSSSY